jgi:hypothetical protein
MHRKIILEKPLLNLIQIYLVFKLVLKNLINSPNFLFALTFHNMNLDWHGCMAKFEVSIQASFDSLKIMKRVFEFAFELNQFHLSLIPSNYKMKHCRLHITGYSGN